jgi:hypothetical protein
VNTQPLWRCNTRVGSGVRHAPHIMQNQTPPTNSKSPVTIRSTLLSCRLVWTLDTHLVCIHGTYFGGFARVCIVAHPFKVHRSVVHLQIDGAASCSTVLRTHCRHVWPIGPCFPELLWLLVQAASIVVFALAKAYTGYSWPGSYRVLRPPPCLPFLPSPCRCP